MTVMCSANHCVFLVISPPCITSTSDSSLSWPRCNTTTNNYHIGLAAHFVNLQWHSQCMPICILVSTCFVCSFFCLRLCLKCSSSNSGFFSTAALSYCPQFEQSPYLVGGTSYVIVKSGAINVYFREWFLLGLTFFEVGLQFIHFSNV